MQATQRRLVDFKRAKQAGLAVERASDGVNENACHVEGIAQMAEANHLVIAQAEQGGGRRLGKLSRDLQNAVARFDV